MSSKRYFVTVNGSGELHFPPIEVSADGLQHFGALGPLELPKAPKSRLAAYRDQLNQTLPTYGPWKVLPFEVEPSLQYRRMWRDGAETEEGIEKLVAGNEAQLGYLVRQLEAIFRVVEPNPKAMSVWGHEIRNLLIIACTEVEAQLRAILRANEYKLPGNKRDHNTADYFKLKRPMKLGDYSLKLRLFPDVPTITPFRTWSKAQPTRSLAWYGAYNQVKHDRERNFHLAQLRHAISAVAACVVVTHAQFGWEANIRGDVFSFFELDAEPTWKPQERYHAHPAIPRRTGSYPFA